MSASEKLITQLGGLSDEAVPQLIEKLKSPEQLTRRFASALLIDLGDARAVGPLREMLDDPTLTQEQKGAVLPLLDALGAPVDDDLFRRAIPDPRRHARESLSILLEDVERPAAAEALLQSMNAVPAELHAGFVRSNLVSRADRRLVGVFAALLYHERDDVVLTAIDGIERLKEPSVIPLLEERSMYDPSPAVRRASESAFLRLQVRTAGREPLPWHRSAPFPLAHCFISTIDGSGGQVIFLSWTLPSGDLRTIDMLVNDREGLKDCFGFHTDQVTLDEMMEGFEPVEFVEISLRRACEELGRARQISLHAGRRTPPTYALYQGWLVGDDARTVDEFPVPGLDGSREPSLLEECPALLDLDEFDSWFFEPDEVDAFVEHYSSLVHARRTKRRVAELTQLLQDAINAIVDDTYRNLLADRLGRQAWLLAQIYEDEREPLMALAAAKAMGTGPVAEHPLLMAMMERSLFNALDTE